jgi:hypothetical protein
MASWEYEPVNVPVASGGEPDADLGLRAEEGQVGDEEMDAAPHWHDEPSTRL